MLICEHASINVNLHYSALKFIQIKGFTWEGNIMPLKIAHLGELAHQEAQLVDDQGHRQSGTLWGLDVLYGRFDPKRRYDLSLRLEYTAPYRLDEIRPDFEDIDPQSYTFSLDFNPHNMYMSQPQVKLGLGPWEQALDANKSVTMRGPKGLGIKLETQADRCFVCLTGERRIPLAYRVFPTLAIRSGASSSASSTRRARNGVEVKSS